ncbi:MAG: helix-turn-helix transcriptional regulator [Acidimicrobiales bacterium]
MVRPLPDDTRGIVDPVAMMRHVDFARSDPGPHLDGVVAWFWSVAWELPVGMVHEQEVLNHPAGNISIGTLDDAGRRLDPADGRVYGVMTRRSVRRLALDGWTVAARSAVGGLGVLLDAPAVTATDAELRLDALPGLDARRVLDDVRQATTNDERIGCLRSALDAMVERRDSRLVAEGREVANVAAIAETDRSVRRVDDLAGVAGVSVRTLQRLFDQHVGASPSFVIRRWRIIEAAESARLAIDGDGEWPGWASIAAELGYADQAHLTRDFRRHLGLSPSAYLTQASAG